MAAMCGVRIRLRISLRDNSKEDPLYKQSVIGTRNVPEGPTECERRISMRKNAVALASFLLLLVAAVIGLCARPYHEENETYYFVATNINLPYLQEEEARVSGAGKALRMTAELV